jgi:hypothetical protein
MKTKEQLQAMSDFEVNKALAELLGHKNCRKNPYSAEKVFFDASESSECESTAANYCNTPDDIMPLAFEHKIRISPYMDIWVADFVATDVSVYHANPLRAIACCLILVLQEQSNGL